MPIQANWMPSFYCRSTRLEHLHFTVALFGIDRSYRTPDIGHPGQLSLAIPPWVGAMSTSQRAVMPCGWGVKAGMVREWVTGKTV